MGVLARYSKLPESEAITRALKVRLGRNEGESAPAVSPRVHRLQQRLPAEVRAQLLRDYEAGVTFRDLEAKYDIGLTSIKALVAASGIPRRISRLSEADKTRIVELYQSGMSLEAVGREVGCSPSNVRMALIALGIPRRGAHER